MGKQSALILAGLFVACARSGLELGDGAADSGDDDSFGSGGVNVGGRSGESGASRGGNERGGAGAIGGTNAVGGAGGFGNSSGSGNDGGKGGAPACGDSSVDAGETCDDGNRTPGDGCSERCRAEPVLVSLGSNFGCALSSTGVVKCWGGNESGQLGVGDNRDRGDEPGEMGENLPAVDLGSGRRATTLACGYQHTCALLDDGSLKCWGWNHEGQLGLGHRKVRGRNSRTMGDALPPVDLGTGRRAVALGVGGRRSCALLDDGSVKCWGENFSGELGLGDVEPHGSGRNQMGDALPSVALGSGRRATRLAAGGSHTCAVLDDESIKCWGANSSGQLGVGDTLFRGSRPMEMGDALPVVALSDGSLPLGIEAGISHTCAFLLTRALFCWGFNAAGQLGLGDAEARGDQSGEMGAALSAVDLDTRTIPVGIASGYTHTCAVLLDGSVKCWGGNYWGELGLGHTRSLGLEPGQMGDDLPRVDLGASRQVRSVLTKEVHTCALLDDGSVKCWGSNENGRLGLGDTEGRGDEPGEMGDALPALDLGF